MSLSPWDLSGTLSFDFSLYRPRRPSYVYATQLARRRNESYRHATKSDSCQEPGLEDFIEGLHQHKKRKNSYRQACTPEFELRNVAAEINHVGSKSMPDLRPNHDDWDGLDFDRCSRNSTPMHIPIRQAKVHTEVPDGLEDGARETILTSPSVDTVTVKHSRLQYRKNLIVLSVSFILVFTAFRSVQNLQSSLNAQHRLGVIAMGCVHGTMFLTCLFAPVLINKLTSKWTIVLGLLFYLFWIAANFYPHFYTLIPTSIGVGFGQSLAWGAQVTYIQKLALDYAHLSKELTHQELAKFNGVFLACFQTTHIWGNVVSSLMLMYGGHPMPQNPMIPMDPDGFEYPIDGESAYLDPGSYPEGDLPEGHGIIPGGGALLPEGPFMPEGAFPEGGLLLHEDSVITNPHFPDGAQNPEYGVAPGFGGIGLPPDGTMLPADADLLYHDKSHPGELPPLIDLGPLNEEDLPPLQLPSGLLIPGPDGSLTIGDHSESPDVEPDGSPDDFNLLDYLGPSPGPLPEAGDYPIDEYYDGEMAPGPAMNIMYCGVYDHCREQVPYVWNISSTAVTSASDAVLKLMGSYLVFAFMGFIIIVIFLEKIGAKQDPEKPCLQIVWSNVQQLARHKTFRLLIPLMIFNGFEQGFVYADFNKSYISCTIGIEYVGFNMITLGMTNSIFSILIGLVSRHIPREAIIGLGGILHIGLMVFLLVWIPDPSILPVFFVVSALWGICDAIWQTQCNSLVNLSCPDAHDVAFQNFRMLQGLGAALAFSLGAFVCVDVKIYIIISLMVLAILFYARAEYRIRQDLDPYQDASW